MDLIEQWPMISCSVRLKILAGNKTAARKKEEKEEDGTRLDDERARDSARGSAHSDELSRL